MLISWGRDKVTGPVETEAVIWFAVPVIDVTPALVNVTELPNDTAPPPDMPVPAVTVREEFVRDALAIEERVFEAPEIVLFVSVSVVALPTYVSVP